ncbi:hypothetical protein B0H14DRAFT_899978 [Mycena olivaceomarginata]|nr:hypothetical protein B0H14DRAFT_899978 [Mycena olivaceomarginata]
MVSGHPSGAQCGHRSMQGCIDEWQEHCALGVHPHPAAPPTPSVPPRATAGPPSTRGRPVAAALQKKLQRYCMPDLTSLSLQGVAPEGQRRAVLGEDASSPVSPPSPSTSTSLSSPSSITATTWAGVPQIARYFAIWGGRIVYTDRGQAREAFLEAEGEGTRPRILSTSDYDEAQAFSESIHWI